MDFGIGYRQIHETSLFGILTNGFKKLLCFLGLRSPSKNKQQGTSLNLDKPKLMKRLNGSH